MAMTAKLWTLNGLATELAKDRRAVGRMLAGVEPDGKAGKSDAWLMATAVRVMLDREEIDLTEEKARLTREQADKAEMENEVRRGELLERGLVDRAVIGAFARVRAKLLAIPAKLAPRMAREMDAAEAEGMIRASVIDTLRELSETDVGQLEDDDGDVVEGANSAA